jgi:four helix bundle protein
MGRQARGIWPFGACDGATMLITAELSMAGEIRGHRDIIAWQKAFALGLDVYRLARTLPKEELFGLGSQLRRGAVAVASNIAEGYGRGSTLDYLRFLKIARGCLYELDTQLLFAVELNYTDNETHASLQAQLNECGRILAGLIRSIEKAASDQAS